MSGTHDNLVYMSEGFAPAIFKDQTTALEDNSAARGAPWTAKCSIQTPCPTRRRTPS